MFVLLNGFEKITISGDKSNYGKSLTLLSFQDGGEFFPQQLSTPPMKVQRTRLLLRRTNKSPVRHGRYSKVSLRIIHATILQPWIERHRSSASARTDCTIFSIQLVRCYCSCNDGSSRVHVNLLLKSQLLFLASLKPLSLKVSTYSVIVLLVDSTDRLIQTVKRTLPSNQARRRSSLTSMSSWQYPCSVVVGVFYLRVATICIGSKGTAGTA